MSGFPDTLLQGIDFSQPDVYAFFLALLILLPYWWWHEAIEVNREFARFYREIAKEADLLNLFDEQQVWKNNLVLPQWFDLDWWIISAWACLLGLVCGVVYMHGAQDDNFRRVLIMASSVDEQKAIQASLKRLFDNHQFDRCTVSCSEKEIEEILCKPSPKGNRLILHLPTNADAKVRKAAATIKKMGKAFRIRWETDELDNGVFKYTDLVLERPQDIIFHERVAVVLARNAESKTLLRVKRCLDAGNQRRNAQQWVGFLYVGLVVVLVCCVKKKKASVFGQMLAFSQEAAKRKQNASPPPDSPHVTPSEGSSPSSAPGRGLPRQAKSSKGKLKKKK